MSNTQDQQNNDPKADEKAKGKTVKVRVLLDCEHGACNTVAELAPALAKQAENDGLVDTSAEAVAAAEAAQAPKADAKDKK